MKLDQILSHSDYVLPLKNTTGQAYIVFLQDHFKKYISELKSDPDLLKDISSKVEPRDRLIKRVEDVAEGVLRVIRDQQGNRIAEAQADFEKLMKYLLIFLFAKDSSVCNLRIDKNEFFYRCKYFKPVAGTVTPIMEKRFFFHADFDVREKIGSTRFSPPGFTTLYLTNAVACGYVECRAEDIDNFQGAKYQVKTPLILLDLNPHLPSPSLKATNQELYEVILQYKCILYPLYVACFCLYEGQDPSPQEYIIPQILLRWCQDSIFAGIKYPSTKVKSTNFVGEFFNLAVAPKCIGDQGYCSWLKDEAFYMSDVCSWYHNRPQIEAFFSANFATLKPINPKVEMVDWPTGTTSFYENTEIGKMEFFLRNELPVSDIVL